MTTTKARIKAAVLPVALVTSRPSHPLAGLSKSVIVCGVEFDSDESIHIFFQLYVLPEGWDEIKVEEINREIAKLQDIMERCIKH